MYRKFQKSFYLVIHVFIIITSQFPSIKYVICSYSKGSKTQNNNTLILTSIVLVLNPLLIERSFIGCLYLHHHIDDTHGKNYSSMIHFIRFVSLEARCSHEDGKTSVYACSHTLHITYFGRHLMICIKNINLNYFDASIHKTQHCNIKLHHI